jgi:hypothetical protein
MHVSRIRWAILLVGLCAASTNGARAQDATAPWATMMNAIVQAAHLNADRLVVLEAPDCRTAQVRAEACESGVTRERVDAASTALASVLGVKRQSDGGAPRSAAAAKPCTTPVDRPTYTSVTVEDVGQAEPGRGWDITLTTLSVRTAGCFGSMKTVRYTVEVDRTGAARVTAAKGLSGGLVEIR